MSQKAPNLPPGERGELGTKPSPPPAPPPVQTSALDATMIERLKKGCPACGTPMAEIIEAAERLEVVEPSLRAVLAQRAYLRGFIEGVSLRAEDHARFWDSQGLAGPASQFRGIADSLREALAATTIEGQP